MVFKSKWIGIYVIFGEVIADKQPEIKDDVYNVDVIHETSISIEES